MFSLITRLVIFLAIFAFAAVLIEFKKGVITTKREAKVTTVLSKLVDQGTPVIVQPVARSNFRKTKAFTIIPCSGNYCIFLSANDVQSIKSGRSVFSPESGENIGRVVQVASRPGMSDGLYRAYITLAVKPENASKHQVVLVETTRLNNALVIQADAVTIIDGKSYVYKVTGENSAERVEVDLQDHNGLEYVVKSGLSKGDLIVVQGKSMIERFGKINIVQSEK